MSGKQISIFIIILVLVAGGFWYVNQNSHTSPFEGVENVVYEDQSFFLDIIPEVFFRNSNDDMDLAYEILEYTVDGGSYEVSYAGIEDAGFFVEMEGNVDLFSLKENLLSVPGVNGVYVFALEE